MRELVNSYQWAVLTLRSRAHYGDNQAADALWDLISAMEALASSPQEVIIYPTRFGHCCFHCLGPAMIHLVSFKRSDELLFSLQLFGTGK